MGASTHFSFQIDYPAASPHTPAQQSAVMDALQPLLQELLAAQDGQASAVVSSSHRGDGSRRVELTTGLDDAQLTQLLKAFSGRHGVRITAFE
ncbi:MAG: hypothetical protein H7273_00065 [Polaromonas sp.]|nr:hypothetical protein [Polaromonas sp.]